MQEVGVHVVPHVVAVAAHRQAVELVVEVQPVGAVGLAQRRQLHRHDVQAQLLRRRHDDGDVAVEVAVVGQRVARGDDVAALRLQLPRGADVVHRVLWKQGEGINVGVVVGFVVTGVDNSVGWQG